MSYLEHLDVNMPGPDVVAKYQNRNFISISPNDLIKKIDQEGNTIVHLMAKNLDQNAFETIRDIERELGRGSTITRSDVINARNNKGDTPLHVAMKAISEKNGEGDQANYDFISLLVNSFNARTDIPDSQGRVVRQTNVNHPSSSINNNLKSLESFGSSNHSTVSSVNSQHDLELAARLASLTSHQKGGAKKNRAHDNYKDNDFVAKNKSKLYEERNSFSRNKYNVNKNKYNVNKQVANDRPSHEKVKRNEEIRAKEKELRTKEERVRNARLLGGYDNKKLRDAEKRLKEQRLKLINSNKNAFAKKYLKQETDDSDIRYNDTEIFNDFSRKSLDDIDYFDDDSDDEKYTMKRNKIYDEEYQGDFGDEDDEDFQSRIEDTYNDDYDDFDENDDVDIEEYEDYVTQSRNTSYLDFDNDDLDDIIDEDSAEFDNMFRVNNSRLKEEDWFDDENIDWDEDYDMNEQSRPRQKTASDEIYDSFLKKIMDMLEVDEQTARLYRAALKVHLEEAKPELKGRANDSAKVKEMEKFFTNKKKLTDSLAKIDIEGIKKKLQERRAEIEARRAERAKNPKKKQRRGNKNRETSNTNSKPAQSRNSLRSKSGYLDSEDIVLSSEY